MKFITHSEVGAALAGKIEKLDLVKPVVLAIPPGGVRIAWEVARRLNAPMDVLMVNDILVPSGSGHPIGWAVDGQFYPDEVACRSQGVVREYAEILVTSQSTRETGRERALRHGHAAIDLVGRTAILVTDGSVDWHELQAAIQSLKHRTAGDIVYAAPVAGAGQADLVEPPGCVISLYTSEDYRSVMLVNAGYRHTTDVEITHLLDLARTGVGRMEGGNPESGPVSPAPDDLEIGAAW